MKNEKIVKDLQLNIESVLYKYEVEFKNSEIDVNEFLSMNFNKINSEFAKLITDTIHTSIINGVSSRKEDFIKELIELTNNSFIELINRLLDMQIKIPVKVKRHFCKIYFDC
ncbi:hypothetical protein SAMN02927937_02851 [Paenimyroides aquimaris]|uniref:Uncharacterized protein n=1 Tax=Paenimyroides marinum TaxID=1159016 RepID=A0A1H6MMQ6_9FLAO|nr:hypothetical protein [Paenimyroides aquimaris]SEI03111.1 hypothetical protein SAMN02927937_02851 [Paenimyroides aquimaris]